MNFTNWTVEKKIKPADLSFYYALKAEQHRDLFSKLADNLALLNPTYTEGLQLLEIITDLILMGHNKALFENSQNLSQYSTHLKTLRYPVTTTRDEELKQKLEALPWPVGTKPKFERRGDRAGVEVKFFISNSTDLTKILAALERVKSEFPK